MTPQAPTPPPKGVSTSYVQDVEASLYKVTEDARELLQRLLAADAENARLKQEVADLRSGEEFRGELIGRQAYDWLAEGAKYWFGDAYSDKLSLCTKSNDVPYREGGVYRRYTGPTTTATLPEAGLQETEKSTAGFAEAGEELKSGEPEDTTPLPEKPETVEAMAAHLRQHISMSNVGRTTGFVQADGGYYRMTMDFQAGANPELAARLKGE